MIALLLALSVAAPTSADIQAASDKFRANSVLMGSLIQHAAPLLHCTSKAVSTSHAGDHRKGGNEDKEYQAYMNQMSVAAQNCGVTQELEFWTSSVKAAFPDFSDELAKQTAASGLSFVIFDYVINDA